MGGGGSSTPEATYEEKTLANLADQKYKIATGLTGGSDYFTKDANVDRTGRYTERAIGDTARMLGAMKETPSAPVTGPVDLSANLLAINAGKTQADLDTAAKKNALAETSLGNVASSTSALHQEGLRKQAIAQAEKEASNATKLGYVNAAASAGTAYAMNYKKINPAVKELFKSSAAKMSVNTPWGGR